MEEEVWIDIIGHVGLYQVSNRCRIKNAKTNKILKPYEDTTNGYPMVTLSSGKRKTATVHRIAAIAFIPNPENLPQVHHRNGIKTDNRLDNLEWITARGNSQHAWDSGLNYTSDKKREAVRAAGRKNNWSSKLLLNLTTGIYYDSIKEATASMSSSRKVSKNYLSNKLNGWCKNNTDFTLV